MSAYSTFRDYESNATENTPWKRNRVSVVAGFTALMLLGLSADSIARSSHQHTILSSTTSLTSSSHLKSKLSFEIVGEYDGHPGSRYPFVRADRVIEPARESILKVTVDDESLVISDCEWSVTRTSGFGNAYPMSETSVTMEYVGPSSDVVEHDQCGATVNVPSPGKYEATVTVTLKSGVTTTLTETLECYYVRRELHSISELDWSRFLDTYVVLMHTPTSEGRKQYGEWYRSLTSIASVHLDRAGQKPYDHIHEGMGLLTQHIALTMEFERSMQTVNPAFAMPYWDYTIDHSLLKMGAEGGDANYGGFGAILTSPLFSDDHFGNVGLEKPNKWHTIEAGRFAFQTVGLNDTSDIHSPYGYMRAPWNLNPSPYITRYHKMCDHKITDLYSWPSCATHYEMVYKYETFYEMSVEAGFGPHGPVHVYLGGIGGGCDSWSRDHYPFSELTETALTYIKLNSFILLKELYRYDLIEFPKSCSLDELSQHDMITMVNGDKRTKDAKCAFHCNFNVSDAKKILHFAQLGEHINSTFFSEEYIYDLTRKLFCSESFWPGDHLEAASAFEASFWPIHPTLDRLVQFRLLTNPFKTGLGVWFDPKDGKEDTTYCNKGSQCNGHHAGDITSFKAVVKGRDGSYALTYLSNAEVLASVDANTYQVPYIYDKFTWAHCEAEGFYFK